MSFNQYTEELLNEALPLKIAKRYTGYSKGMHKDYLKDVFGDQYRIYLNIDAERSDLITTPLIQKIKDHIEAKGYTLISYIEGLASDNRKNKIKIGKLIKDDPELLKAYEKDPLRTTKDLMIVISRHPYDIAGMSTDRGWDSCMNLYTGMNKKFVKQDIVKGTIIAYLVSVRDKNINNPLARVLIKPYKSQQKDTTYFAGTVYGINNKNFKQTVQKWVDEKLNQNKAGIFKLTKGLYTDKEDFERRIVDPTIMSYELLVNNPTKLFDMLDIKYSVKGDLVRVGNLDISNLGLTKLPFEKITLQVTGDFDCSNNQLTTLEGGPKIVTGDYDCSYNNLTNIKGAPKVVKTFCAAYNKITTLEGGPEEVKDGYTVAENELKSLKGAPLYIPHSFNCSNNKLKDFKNGPVKIGHFLHAYSNPLQDLQGLPVIDCVDCVGLSVATEGGRQYFPYEIKTAMANTAKEYGMVWDHLANKWTYGEY